MTDETITLEGESHARIAAEKRAEKAEARLGRLIERAIRPAHRRPGVVRCLLCDGQGLRSVDFHIGDCPLRDEGVPDDPIQEALDTFEEGGEATVLERINDIGLFPSSLQFAICLLASEIDEVKKAKKSTRSVLGVCQVKPWHQPGGRPPADHGEDLWQMAIHVEEQDATIQAQARRIVELEKLTDSFCDQLEDRMWHAEDGTWWRRVGDRLHSADPPGEAEIARMARRHDD